MRTIDNIKDEMKEKYINSSSVRAKYGITGDVTFDETFSPASLEAIWINIVSLAIYGVEFLFQQHKEEVKALETRMRVGHKEWWINIVKSFQYGHSLTYNESTGLYEYAVIDQDAQIIKFVDVRVFDSHLVILINTADGEGNPEKIPVDSLIRDAFKSYIDKVKIAGIPLVWDSYNPDKLKVYLDVVYDPLIMKPSGELIIEGIKPVNKALINYLRSLPFGSGIINKTKLIDQVQAVSGVIDVYPNRDKWLVVKTGLDSDYQSVPGQDLLSYGGSFLFDDPNTDINVNYIPQQ